MPGSKPLKETASSPGAEKESQVTLKGSLKDLTAIAKMAGSALETISEVDQPTPSESEQFFGAGQPAHMLEGALPQQRVDAPPPVTARPAATDDEIFADLGVVEDDPYSRGFAEERRKMAELSGQLGQVPTREQYMKETGAKRQPGFLGAWLQSMATPGRAAEEIEKKFERGYQDYIQPQAQKEAAIQKELDLMKATARDPLEPGQQLHRVRYFGEEFTVPANIMGYMWNPIQDFKTAMAQAEAEQRNLIDARPLFPDQFGKGDPIMMSPDAVKDLMKSMLQYAYDDIEQAYLAELRKKEQGRPYNREIVDVLGPRWENREKLEAQAKAKQAEAAVLRAKKEGGPGAAEKPKVITPVDYEDQTWKLSKAMWGDPAQPTVPPTGASGFSQYLSEIDVDPGDVKDQNERNAYSSNFLLHMYGQPAFRMKGYGDWVDMQLKKTGLFYKGKTYKGDYASIRSALVADFRKNLQKENVEYHGNSMWGLLRDEAAVQMADDFLFTHFPSTHAATRFREAQTETAAAARGEATGKKSKTAEQARTELGF